MPGSSVALAYKLFGHDVSASKAIKGVGGAAKGLGKTFGEMAKTAGGVFAGIGLDRLASSAVSFGKDSMEAFNNTGKTVLGLQRVAGGTAEQMSHLAAAARATGTDTDVLTRSVGILAKNMSGGGAKTLAGLGIAVKDSQGKMRSFADMLPDIADRFAKMPAGTEKTALALKLFGKQGLAMLPILNKGSKGLDELAKSSDEAGATLSGSDLEAVKANTKAKREMDEAVLGLQVTIGRYLYPAITQLTIYFRTNVMPVIRSATTFFLEHRDVLLKVGAVIAIIIGGIKLFAVTMRVIAVVTRVWAAAQMLLNAAFLANPITWIIIAIVALIAVVVLAYNNVGWFRDLVNAAWAKIKTAISAVVSWFQNTAWPILRAVIGFIIGYYKLLWTVFSTVVKWIVDKGAVLLGWFGTLKDKLGAVLGKIWEPLRTGFQVVIDAVKTIWNTFLGGKGIHLPAVHAGPINFDGLDFTIPRLAAGGIVPRTPGGRLAILGEGRYDEAVVPLNGRSFGGSTHVHIHGGVIIGSNRDAAARDLVDLIRRGSAGGRAVVSLGA